VSGGRLRVGSDGTNPGDAAPLGLVPTTPAVNLSLSGGGGLQYGAAFALNPNRQISLTTAGSNGVVDTNGFDVSIAGRITGPGNLFKTGAGTLTLSGSPGTYDYTGGTIVAGGTLTIGASQTLPTGTTVTVG